MAGTGSGKNSRETRDIKAMYCTSVFYIYLRPTCEIAKLLLAVKNLNYLMAGFVPDYLDACRLPAWQHFYFPFPACIFAWDPVYKILNNLVLQALFVCLLALLPSLSSCRTCLPAVPLAVCLATVLPAWLPSCVPAVPSFGRDTLKPASSPSCLLGY